MSPDEVIIQLKKQFNIIASRPTLLRYETLNLIPSPKRGGGGPGGRWTDYPEDTPAQFFASWSLIHGNYWDASLKILFGEKAPSLPPSTVSVIRKYVAVDWFEINHEGAAENTVNYISEFEKDALDNRTKKLLDFFQEIWVDLYTEAKTKLGRV